MKSPVRSLIIVILSALAAPAHIDAAESTQETVVISGNAGSRYVRMKGLPGTPVTDKNGYYTALVPRGWAGTIRPMKEGYTFSPPQSVYAAVQSNCENQDYTAHVMSFLISGSVGVAGITMTGLPGNPVTDAEGRYRVRVPYGWAGTVTPTKRGYEFEPPSRVYDRVVEDFENQDYKSVEEFTIAGNTGIPGVLIQGLPGSKPVLTDENGVYTVKVARGWTGSVTPTKDGYTFHPRGRMYVNVGADQTSHDYVSEAVMLTLSDRIVVGGEPIEGVKVTADPGGVSDVTDAQGRYKIEVPYGWTGKLTIAKEGYEFDPPSKSFMNLTTHVVDGMRPADPLAGRFLKAGSSHLFGLPSELSSSVLVIPTEHIEDVGFAEIGEDLGVMLQILQERLGGPQTIMGVFNDYGDYFGTNSQQARALYIQGTGVLLIMDVSFPLPASSETQVRTESESAPPVDPVWQRAREKLYSPRAGMRRPSSETHRKTLDQFKDELLNMLKHAANIRHVDPNEKVILTVTFPCEETSPVAPLRFRGSSFGGSGGYATGGSIGGFGGGGGSFGTGGGSFRSESYGYAGGFGAMGAGRRSSAGSATTSSRTVLTMQARKADIDAFAKGALGLEQFREKVIAFAY